MGPNRGTSAGARPSRTPTNLTGWRHRPAASRATSARTPTTVSGSDKTTSSFSRVLQPAENVRPLHAGGAELAAVDVDARPTRPGIEQDVDQAPRLNSPTEHTSWPTTAPHNGDRAHQTNRPAAADQAAEQDVDGGRWRGGAPAAEQASNTAREARGRRRPGFEQDIDQAAAELVADVDQAARAGSGAEPGRARLNFPTEHRSWRPQSHTAAAGPTEPAAPAGGRAARRRARAVGVRGGGRAARRRAAEQAAAGGRSSTESSRPSTRGPAAGGARGRRRGRSSAGRVGRRPGGRGPTPSRPAAVDQRAGFEEEVEEEVEEDADARPARRTRTRRPRPVDGAGRARGRAARRGGPRPGREPAGPAASDGGRPRSWSSSQPTRPAAGARGPGYAAKSRPSR